MGIVVTKFKGLSKITSKSNDLLALNALIRDLYKYNAAIIVMPNLKIFLAYDDEEEESVFNTGGYNKLLAEIEEIYFNGIHDYDNYTKNEFYDTLARLLIRVSLEESNLFLIDKLSTAKEFYNKMDVMPNPDNYKEDKMADVEIVYVPTQDFTEIQFERFIEKNKIELNDYIKTSVHSKVFYIKGNLLAPITSLIEFIGSNPGDLIAAEYGPQRLIIHVFNPDKYSKLKLLKKE